MNRIFNIIWSKSKERWIVVSEKVKSNGKVSRSLLLSFALLSSMIAAGVPVFALDPGTLPTGAEVTSGNATITTSGLQMTIDQSSQSMIANWQSFNIGSDAGVRFNQPNSSSTALNRITDQNPTQIMGSLSANGKIFLINPSGIIFGRNARVDVGGLVASSLDMLDHDFLEGKYSFRNSGNAGTILNQGTIKAFPGGVVALIAPRVTNEGTITTQNGSTALGAGNQVSLDFNGDGLISLIVDAGAVEALTENKEIIKAEGGLVVMTAKAADALVQSAVNNSGIIEAKSFLERAGHIILDAAEGMTTISGTLDVSSSESKGGQIVATGNRVLVKSGAHLSASGTTGGGEVLVGGSWQGKDSSIPQATGTIVERCALLEANATNNGNGGTVVAWSDVTNPLSVTRAYGTFEAQGGPNSGNGGRIETSGHWLDVADISLSASALSGSGGVWLLDPYTVTINNNGTDGNWNSGNPDIWTPDKNNSQLKNSAITDRLKSGTSVTIITGGTNGDEYGDITVSNDILTTITTGSPALTLNADRNITISAAIGNYSRTLSLIMNAGGTITGTGAISGTGTTTFNIGSGSGIYSGIISKTNLIKEGTGTLILSGANSYTGTTTINAGALRAANSTALGKAGGVTVASGATLELEGNITIGNKTLSLSGSGFNSSGALRNVSDKNTYGGPITLSAATQINSESGMLNLTGTIDGTNALQVNGFGGVTFYRPLGYSTILESFTADAATTLLINGGFVLTSMTQTYSGSTTFGAPTLLLASDITATGAVSATERLSLSAGGNVTFSNPLNNFSTVQMYKAGTVSLVDVNELTVSGITASGPINVATLTGDLTICGRVLTKDATPAAIIFNAGKNEAAGTATGGNIIIRNSPKITTGPGGIATFYTGSISGSTGLTVLIGSGSGHFRYNSDESTTNFTTPLSAGLNAIYRERPTITVTGDSKAITYGENPEPLTGTITSAFQNGDTSSQAFSGSINIHVEGMTSSSGHYTAGEHTMTPSGLTSLLGYNISYSSAGMLTVNKKALTVSGITAENKTYNGNTDATINTDSAIFNNMVSGDKLSFSSVTGEFNDKNVGTSKIVTLTSSYDGTDRGNYKITDQASTTADITAKPLTISGLTANDKNYDGTTLATVNTSGVLFNGWISPDDLYLSVTGQFSDPNIATDKIVTLTSTYAGIDRNNYNITSQSSTTASILPAGTLPTVLPLVLLPPPVISVTVEPPLITSVPGVIIEYVAPPAGQSAGLIVVAVPKAVVILGASLTIPLPEEVKKVAAETKVPEAVTLEGGSQLPDWLQYDSMAKVFKVNSVPVESIPVKVELHIGDKSWIVEITS